MHHFSRTDGFFAGNKSLEIVQLFNLIEKNQIAELLEGFG